MQKFGLKKWSIIFCCIFLLGIMVLAIEIYRFSSISVQRKSDVAIVLGAAVWGEQPSPVFLERINHAIALYETGMVDKIIFTGGIGRGDEVSEAEVGRLTAVSQGVAEEDVFIETASTVTYENLTGACAIIQDAGWETAVLVSDPLHMKRATTMATDLDMDIVSSPTPTTRYRTWRSKMPALIYETWFYTLYLGQRPFLDQTNCGIGNN